MKFGVLSVAFAALLACQAEAQGNCGTFQQVAGMLFQKYGETPVETRTETYYERASVFIFSANAETGSWTFLVTDGYQMCILSEGEDYHDFDFHAAVDELIGVENA